MDRRSGCSKLWRFSLSSLLFVVILLCGYLSGFRMGYNSGAIQRAHEQITVRTYPVADLVTPFADDTTEESRLAKLDELINLIVKTVEAESWVENNGAGEGEINSFPSANSLIVAQTGRVHCQVAELLAQLRELAAGPMAKQTIPILQTLAATREETPFFIQQTPAGLHGPEILNRWFDAAVDSVISSWGEPEFRGDAAERGGRNASQLAATPH